MHYLKKPIAILIALIVPLALVTSANAADETVNATTNLTPRSGSFYKEAQVAANLNIHAEVTTPPSSPKVNPMKNVKVTFPAGMSFKPNDSKTPVCPDSKLSAQSNLADPGAVANSCKSSVVGTGTAAIYLAKVNHPNALITDPILIAFNAGKNSKGQPMMKIYGYSDVTHVGILMNGTLKGSVLDIAVPVLSNDSAVKYFDLNFPGGTLNRPELNVNVKGLDPNYVEAKCATGVLKTNATFELGERTYPGGVPTTPTVTVNSPETTQNCTGQNGKAKLGGMKVSGPASVKSGKKGTFKVTVKNTGTATAKNVVVSSSRGGQGKGGNIAPGASKTVTVKTKISGRKNSKVAVKFTAKSGSVKASITKKVKVK